MIAVREKINLFIRRQNLDGTYWVIFFAFIVISVLSIFSSASYLVYRQNSILGPIRTHLFFLFLGVITAFVIQFFSSRFIRRSAYIVLFASFIGLCLLLCHFLPFIRPINHAYRWIFIGSMTVQPAEFAKISLIIVVADLLDRIKEKKDVRHYFLVTLVLTMLICGLILINNLSTALLLGGVIVIMWALADIPQKYIWKTIGAATILLISIYAFVFLGFMVQNRPVPSLLSRTVTHINRVTNWLDNSSDASAKIVVNDANYQEVWSKVAIANGGKTPFGVGPGNSEARNHLPLAYEEYNFAIIAEEFGLVGVCFVIMLYVIVLFRSFFVSYQLDNYAATLMVSGLALMLCIQALVSMMVACGIGIVTGQPLPLLCKGGTSILTTSAYFGIFMAVSREQKRAKQKHDNVQKNTSLG